MPTSSSYVLKYVLGTGLNWWLIYYQCRADAGARELAWCADKADKMTKFYINGQTLKIYTSYLIIEQPKSKLAQGLLYKLSWILLVSRSKYLVVK